MKRYSQWQIVLHWVTLLFIVVAYTVIEIKDDFIDDDDTYLLLKTIHFNAGVLIWLCMSVRIILRFRHATPPIIPAPNLWQERLAALMHIVLYACFFSMPVLGVLTQYFNGASWSLMGVDVAGISPSMRPVGRVIKSIHENLGTIGYYLIGLHTVAALFHHYIQKDNTLLRMLPLHNKR